VLDDPLEELQTRLERREIPARALRDSASVPNTSRFRR
jgi:hypothetical protein